ncbi:uncharacterized protein Dvir_GJ26160 [Drosophila virilis]|uniref:Uncharacterized protein n=1 Tax=Drosophila virilis TaxID=7244 RepID=A0A0Q9WII6_DROVI|nr:uncharacterized protein Dvir_GJ26160 [Drosophila virilis]
MKSIGYPWRLAADVGTKSYDSKTIFAIRDHLIDQNQTDNAYMTSENYVLSNFRKSAYQLRNPN